MLADPSKLTPAIVLCVVNVAADPVVFWLSNGIRSALIVPEVISEAEWFPRLNVVPLKLKPVPAEYVVLVSDTVLVKVIL